MEVVVNRDALLAEVAAAQGITSSRTTIPILSNLLIEAQDGFLKISASNIEQTLTTKAPATVKKAGVATVPARKLYDYLKLLPAGDISIKLLDNDGSEFRPVVPTPRWSAWHGTATPRSPPSAACRR